MLPDTSGTRETDDFRPQCPIQKAAVDSSVVGPRAPEASGSTIGVRTKQRKPNQSSSPGGILVRVRNEP